MSDEQTAISPHDQAALMRLRVELYAAAQLLKGGALAEFKALIREVQEIFDPEHHIGP